MLRTMILFVLASPAAFAMGAPQGGGQNAGGSMMTTLIMFAAIILIMYLLMIRPQQKRQKEHQNMLNELKKGDRVVTSAGMHGTIKDIDGNTMQIQIAENVVVKFDKSAIVNKEA